RGDVAMAGLAAHVDADLGQYVLGGPPANPIYSVQHLDGSLKRAHALGNLLVQKPDLASYEIDVVEQVVPVSVAIQREGWCLPGYPKRTASTAFGLSSATLPCVGQAPCWKRPRIHFQLRRLYFLASQHITRRQTKALR